jgi:hypothetical protein
MKTQDELFNEYIDLISQMQNDRSLSDNGEFLDKCDKVWYALDKETMERVENHLNNQWKK